MTREEAIHELKMCKAIIEQSGHDYLDERDVPLIDLAIEALSAPQTDLISRADAIDAVMKHKMPFSIQQEVAREIDALPSADRPSGEWEYDVDADDSFCTNCHKYAIRDMEMQLESDFCPNCGARMKGGEE